MALEIAPGVWRTQLNQGLEHAGKDSLWVKPFDKLRQRLKSHTTGFACAITQPAAGCCIAPGSGPMCSWGQWNTALISGVCPCSQDEWEGCVDSHWLLQLKFSFKPKPLPGQGSPERGRSALLTCLPFEVRQQRKCPGNAAALQVINRVTASKLHIPEPYSTVSGATQKSQELLPYTVRLCTKLILWHWWMWNHGRFGQNIIPEWANYLLELPYGCNWPLPACLWEVISLLEKDFLLQVFWLRLGFQ